MDLRLLKGLGAVLVIAACVPTGRAGAPAPVAGPSEASRPQPAPPVPPRENPAVTPRPATPALEPAAVPDSSAPLAILAPSDSIRLARIARDSALDASVLEAVAAARPADSGSTADELDPAAWRAMFDIDVVNWMDHHRVRYYLDLFTGPVRERMAIWLDRMPRYEPAIRARLIARGLPGDLAYLPLIESGYSATAVSR